MTSVDGDVIEEHSSLLLLPIPRTKSRKRKNPYVFFSFHRLNMWKIQHPATSGAVSKSTGNLLRNTQQEKLP